MPYVYIAINSIKTVCIQAYKIINKMINENQFISDGMGELGDIKFKKYIYH